MSCVGYRTVFIFQTRYGQTSGSGDFRVAEYRAFTVGTDGHFVGFEPIVCDTDDQAIERAKQLLDGRAIEVWCAERLIAKLKPPRVTK